MYWQLNGRHLELGYAKKSEPRGKFFVPILLAQTGLVETARLIIGGFATGRVLLSIFKNRKLSYCKPFLDETYHYVHR